MQSLQVDGGLATPPNELETFTKANGIYQVDGADEENEHSTSENQTLTQDQFSGSLKSNGFVWFTKI